MSNHFHAVIEIPNANLVDKGQEKWAEYQSSVLRTFLIAYFRRNWDRRGFRGLAGLASQFVAE
jgi:hypothetical protein